MGGTGSVVKKMHKRKGKLNRKINRARRPGPVSGAREASNNKIGQLGNCSKRRGPFEKQCEQNAEKGQ